MYVETEAQLRELYGYAQGRAKLKELQCLEQHSINFMGLSPLVLLSTSGTDGRVDCSPRGGQPGFVRVPDEHTVLLPDAKGNNRLDSLVNITETGQAGCLFLIPGVNETLRINGRAKISLAEEHLSLFADERQPPKTCIEIKVEEVFLHCAKALMRSKLWDEATKISRDCLPSMGQMINDQIGDTAEPESNADMVQRYLKDL